MLRGLSENRVYQILWALACLSLLSSLPLPYVGEEGIYAIITQEMQYQGNYIKPTLYGAQYGRPPLYHWFILAAQSLIGDWRLSLRAVSILMTSLSSISLYAWVNRLKGDKSLALLSVCLFLSGDLLFKRGWLAYADPSFAYFSFASMACLWLACAQSKSAYLGLAGLAMNLAFLCKASTAYVFFINTGLALCCYPPYRRFLFTKTNLAILSVIAMASFCLVFSWHRLTVQETTHGTGVIRDLLNPFRELAYWDYIRQVVYFPLTLLVRFFPGSLLLLYCLWRKRAQVSGTWVLQQAQAHPLLSLAIGIIALNLLPYWINPNTKIRYLLPLYPFIAFVFAYVYQKTNIILAKSQMAAGLLCLLLIHGGFNLLACPSLWDKKTSLATSAQQLSNTIAELPVYVDDGQASTLSLVAQLNANRLSKGWQPATLFPNAPIQAPHFLISIHDTRPGYTYRATVPARIPLYVFEKNS